MVLNQYKSQFLPKPLFQHQLKDYKIILATQSPQRQLILKNLGITDFLCFKSNFPENHSKIGITAAQYCGMTALSKANHLMTHSQLLNELPDLFSDKYMIISSDTVIECDEKIFEKPITPETQFEMLKFFVSKGKIIVHTAVTILSNKNGKKLTPVFHAQLTSNYLTLKKLNDQSIQDYVNTNEALEAAGGFKIQGLGINLFEAINGDYFAIMGLPITTLNEIENVLEGYNNDDNDEYV